MNKEPDLHIRGSTDEDSSSKKLFSKNLKRLMKSRGYTQAQLAKEIGVGQSTVSQWCNGVAEPRARYLEALAKVLHCYKSDLMDEIGTEMKRRIPVYDPVSCGQGAFIDENIIDTLELPENWTNINSEYFANEAQGDSMLPLINNGELLIFEKTDVVPVGRIGAFSLNGEYYCKRLKRYKDGSLWLFSDNEEYPPIPVKPDDDFRFLGFFRFKVSKVQ